MSKGSNKTSSTSTYTPSSTAQNMYSTAWDALTNAADTGYQSYTGELVSPLNSAQTSALGGLANSTTNGTSTAESALGSAYDTAAGTANGVSSDQINSYLNPYLSDVAGTTSSLINQNNAIQQNQVTSNAAASGALGGNRVGYAQASLANQQDLAENSTLANIESSGYNTALNAALTGNAQAQNAASLEGSLGTEYQNTALTGQNAALTAGTVEQQQAQNVDNANYSQWAAAQQYPYEIAQMLLGGASSLGSQEGGTTNGTSSQSTSLLGSLLGLGTAAAGVAKLYAKNGGRIERAGGGQVGAEYYAPTSSTPYGTGSDPMAPNLPSGGYLSGIISSSGGSGGGSHSTGEAPAPAANSTNDVSEATKGIGALVSSLNTGAFGATGADVDQAFNAATYGGGTPVASGNGDAEFANGVQVGTNAADMDGFARGGRAGRATGGATDGDDVAGAYTGTTTAALNPSQPSKSSGDQNVNVTSAGTVQNPVTSEEQDELARVQSLGLLGTVKTKAFGGRARRADGGSATDDTSSDTTPKADNSDRDIGKKFFQGFASIQDNIESGGNPTATNARSSATGAGQFTDDTWRDMAKRSMPQATQGLSDQQILDLRKDPDMSRDMTANYAIDNAQHLSSRGLPVDYTTLSLSHRFGGSGASSLLMANADAPVDSVLSRDAIKSNPDLAGKTVGQVIGQTAAEVHRHMSGDQYAQADQAETSDASPGEAVQATGQRLYPNLPDNGLGGVQAGLGATRSVPQFDASNPDGDNGHHDLSMGLIAAGLGMLANPNSNPLVSVGKGGLGALQYLQQAQEQRRQNARLSADTAQTQNAQQMEQQRLGLEGVQQGRENTQQAIGLSNARTQQELEAGRLAPTIAASNFGLGQAGGPQTGVPHLPGGMNFGDVGGMPTVPSLSANAVSSMPYIQSQPPSPVNPTGVVGNASMASPVAQPVPTPTPDRSQMLPAMQVGNIALPEQSPSDRMAALSRFQASPITAGMVKPALDQAQSALAGHQFMNAAGQMTNVAGKPGADAAAAGVANDTNAESAAWNRNQANRATYATTQSQLLEMADAAQHAPPGAFNSVIAGYASEIGGLAQTFGVPVSSNLTNYAAAHDAMEKISTQLASNMTAGAGQTAVDALHTIQRAVPHSDLSSPQSFSALLRSTAQQVQVAQDIANYGQQRSAAQAVTPDDRYGWQTQFFRDHPAAMYASRVSPVALPLDQDHIDRSKLKTGFNYKSPSGAVMQWTGNGFANIDALGNAMGTQ